MHTANAICTQPTSEVILCTAKSKKNFQDAIMLVILPKIDLHLLKAALIFCLRYRYCHVLIILQKEFKNLFPIINALFSYKSTLKIFRTLEKCEKNSTMTGASTLLYKHFSHVLKNLHVQTMHLGCFYSVNVRLLINSFLKLWHKRTWYANVT